MKLGPVTKLKKIGTATLKRKKIDDDVMSTNRGVFFIFPIYDQFGTIQKPDSGTRSVMPIFLLTVFFYVKKAENRTNKFLSQLSCYCFE